MTDQLALRAMAEHIEKNDDFLLIAHTSPDGDTLGSVLALTEAMLGMGKQVQTVCEHTVPHIYRFLPNFQRVLLPKDAKPARHVIAVDCADEERMGEARIFFDRADTTGNVDHHMTNASYAKLNVVNGGLAAAGELIFDLIGLLPWPMNKQAATCLYCALMTDTGNFAYRNTRPSTLRIAADLLERGADNNEINRMVYRTVPLCKQKLLGVALTNAAFFAEGAIGLTYVTLEDFARVGASEEDTEGIIDHIRDIEGVEIAILIREAGAGLYKVSLRSKLRADVGAIAQSLGGGGHRQAAGCTIKGEYLDIYQKVTALAEKAVRA